MRERKDSIDEEGAVKYRQWNVADYERVYNLLKLVFRFTSSGFVKFFFVQKDKYLTPFVLFIFKCLEGNSFTTKSRSIAMLTFILNQA
jgi:hypothetical protein